MTLRLNPGPVQTLSPYLWSSPVLVQPGKPNSGLDKFQNIKISCNKEGDNFTNIATLSGALVGPMPKHSRRMQAGLAHLGCWAKKKSVSDFIKAEENKDNSAHILQSLHCSLSSLDTTEGKNLLFLTAYRYFYTIKGYESLQVHFGDHMSAVELDGFESFDGDNRNDGHISFNCGAIDAHPAHLQSPKTKFHYVSNCLVTICILWSMIPTVPQAQSALVDVVELLRLLRTCGHRQRPNELMKSLEKRLMGMEYFLWAYIDSGTWMTAANKTATFIGWGTYMSRKLREWSTVFILDHVSLPLSKYGVSWTKSRINDEDLKSELVTHLQSLGKNVTATAIIDYFAQPDVMQWHGLRKNISLATAKQWMAGCGFHWTVTCKGHFILTKQIPSFMGWVHMSKMSTPQPKGERPTLMVAEFVSADHGWLCSPDGTELARILFHPGKGHDGYFSNDQTIHHVERAMAILEKHYPNEDHVFIFDNASTHMKRSEDSLSAQNMPKGCREWGVDVPVQDASGQAVLGPNGKPLTTKARITYGFFKDETPQEFYWPDGHHHSGKFKGMAQILIELGFNITHLKAQCKHCEPSATMCCCHQILFNQPDFINIETILESTCPARGFHHVKIFNSIPQVYGCISQGVEWRAGCMGCKEISWTSGFAINNLRGI
ncbi:hypothetical protein F5J12DRAFT_781787 [Pisolithus orientalis]|uniref:uncharacterized protein n=1 Tax=Pisolithus orientalis TaxID=936130 RepID=UPI0022255547|nr:uncharacterized protein F5J12DRAFT_781787 [Pisolithus orientalis]KAI6010804.1 hypothetical protein F5J12DRAFT_781787 [Pisolithus orientalis]